MNKYQHEPIQRFLGILPSSADIEMNLLKGHLLVEEVLSAVIQVGLRRPEHLTIERMQFSAKARLARALFKGPDEPWIWKAINRLNDARNSLAHGLNSSKTAELIVEFVAYAKEQEGIRGMSDYEEQKTLVDQLRLAMFAIFAHLVIMGQVREPRANALAEALKNWHKTPSSNGS